MHQDKNYPFINVHSHHQSKNLNQLTLVNHRFGFDHIQDYNTYFSAGIHPWDINSECNFIEFEKLIQQKKCLAIGECGLDKITGTDLQIQKKIFQYQLDLAVKYQKPVIIHCVKAFDELQEICKSYQGKIPLIIHGFNKSSVLAKQLLQQGFYISLALNFVLKNNLSDLPIEKLFLETDDNPTLQIEELYQVVAQKLGLSVQCLKEKFYITFAKLFFKSDYE